ncbi:MAG: hypothetical protein IIW50_02955, partial [Alistipes sp.]|nr:hypothetical protein [Alistipes sp.]
TLLSTIGNLEKLGKLVILCHIPKLIKFLKLTKLPTLTLPNASSVISRTILASEFAPPTILCTNLLSKGSSGNAAIKPKSIAVATEGAKGED